MIRLFKTIGFCAIVVVLFATQSVSAADFFIDPDISSQYTSNVYLNQPEEWDIAFAPRLNTGLDFADYWTLGYQGRVDIFTRHSDLLSHKHELYVLLNPVWGQEGKDGFFARLSAQTQQNSVDYESVDFLAPALSFGLDMEPTNWFRWSLSQSIAYRWFYNDSTASALDAWTSGSMTFTAQTRTTVSPRLRYGIRYFTGQQRRAAGDTDDQQIEAGAHVSQGLWEQAGLQADYAYRKAFEDSVLVLRNMTSTAFSYIGEDFIFSGHRAELGFKQIFQEGWQFGVALRYETREYGGWKLIDAAGLETDDDRSDQRLSPNAWVEYTWWPQNQNSAISEVRTSLEYLFMRQWSNDVSYDTSLHAVMLNLGMSCLL
jgi:hypothetical protein